MEDDFYKVLQVPRAASQFEISKAYRALALTYHPDKNADPAAHTTFLRISEAYNTLKNEVSRNNYDAQTSFSPLINLMKGFKTPAQDVSFDNLMTMVHDMLGEINQTRGSGDGDEWEMFTLAHTQAQHCMFCSKSLQAGHHRLHFVTEHFSEFVKWRKRATPPPKKRRKTKQT